MRRLLSLGCLSALAGCTVGPQHPTTPISLAPAVQSSTIAPVSGPAQQLQAGAQAPPDWWKQFGSPALDALVDRALAANNDLANADAALRQAREMGVAASGASLPQIDAGYQAQRIRASRTLANPLPDPDIYLYSLHTAQVTVTYPLDLFGGQRNKVKSARAATEVAADKLDAARLALIANLVVGVVQQASLRAQIDATQEAIHNNQDILTLLQKRQVIGDIGAADVASQQAALATAEAALPPLQKQLDHQNGEIAILIGVAPGSALPPLPGLDELRLPTELPLSLPSAIVANRPDVRAADAQMRGAGADVGTAIAARLPNITLSATLGGQATAITDMFASGNPFWSLIGGVTQPIFHGGQLLHQQHAAEAALDGAKAQYRAAVLQAFGDVNDALSGLRTDAATLDATTRAVTAADQNLLFTRRQLALGGIGTLAVLNASASDAQARAQQIQAKASRLSDTAALIQAIGGNRRWSIDKGEIMGAVWGVVSGKFVITASGLLIASRIDQGRLQALVDPHAAVSAVSRNFAEQRHLGTAGAEQTSSRRPLTIGIGAEEFDQPSLAIAERMPVPDTDLVIGRDLLAAHIFALDIDRQDLSLLGKGDAERLSRHFIAVPLAMGDGGQLLVSITIDGLQSEAAISLGQIAPLEVGKDFWQSSPPGRAAHITLGSAQLGDIAWPDLTSSSDRVILGPGAFKGRSIVLDLPHRRLWISARR